MDKTTFLFDEAEQYTYTGLLIRMLNSGFDREGKAWTDSGATVSTFYPTACSAASTRSICRNLLPRLTVPFWSKCSGGISTIQNTNGNGGVVAILT